VPSATAGFSNDLRFFRYPFDPSACLPTYNLVG
jgi:hypothetical protein